jgi:aspartate/tyrosine/aromatic aminotransferase
MLIRKSLKRFCWRFTNLKDYPPDPILSLNKLCKLDSNTNKVNLTIGAYRDEHGNPWVLPSVQTAINQIYRGDYNIEYLSLSGDDEFVDLGTDLVYKYSKTGAKLKEEGKIAQLQSLSGTGAIYFLLKLYRDCINPDATVYVQNPSWPIHNTILSNLHMKTEQMPYFDMQTRTFDRLAAKEAHKNVKPRSLVIVQVCGHNPTGFDLSKEDWEEIIEVYKEKEVDVLVDNPYQGYVSGDVAKDAENVGLFIDSGLNVMFAQSFAKNFGLYSGRVGCMSVICSSREEAEKVKKNLSYFVRNTTSTHPKFGSEIVKHILTHPELESQWHRDLQTMAHRIMDMRSAFVSEMKALGSQQDWSYIEEQRGMFALTHLDKETVIRLRNEKSVYLIETGRISISGINPGNVKYLAQSIFDVTEK